MTKHTERRPPYPSKPTKNCEAFFVMDTTCTWSSVRNILCQFVEKLSNLSPAEPLFVFIDHERNCGSKTFYRPSPNHKPRRPEIPSGGSVPPVRLQFTWRCNNTSRKVTKMDTQRARVQCLTSSCVHFPYFSSICFASV